MDPNTLTFTSIAQTNGRPTTVRHRYVTPHTDGQTMLQEIVLAFAEGHEAVRLVSSDGKGVDIDLIETVRGLQAGGQVPGISQDSQARTGVILVGAPQRPIQQQQSILASPSIATPPPRAPSAKAYKKGRIQSQDPDKSKLGQSTAKLLPLDSQRLLHLWTRSLCGRNAEAPWQFHPFKDQPLRELLIKGLLRMPELAGETYAKVETSVKRFITNQNGELRKYHEEKDNAAVTRGSKTYATAEEEAQKWHSEYEPFDWTSNDIPQAAWTFLDTQGLDEETIRRIAGLKGPSKHESAADENSHFTPATDKGKQKRTYKMERPEAGEHEVDGEQEDDNDDDDETWKVLESIQNGKEAVLLRKKEHAKEAVLKRKQRALETKDAAIDTAGNNTQQVRPRADNVAKSALTSSSDPGGRSRGRGRRGGRGEGRRGGHKT